MLLPEAGIRSFLLENDQANTVFCIFILYKMEAFPILMKHSINGSDPTFDSDFCKI